MHGGRAAVRSRWQLSLHPRRSEHDLPAPIAKLTHLQALWFQDHRHRPLGHPCASTFWPDFARSGRIEAAAPRQCHDRDTQEDTGPRFDHRRRLGPASHACERVRHFSGAIRMP